MNHINGVTELNAIDVYLTPWWLGLSLVVAGILAISCLIIIGKSSTNLKILIFGVISLLLISCIAVLGIISCLGIADQYVYTKYEVIVDDTVNLNEFNSTYDTLEHRGDIYVVRFLED